MKNGRCRLHGGKSTGPKDKPAKPGKKHGIYDETLTAEERAIAAEMILGNVDEELKIARIRLRRALIAQEKWAKAPLDEQGLPLIEIVTEVNEKAGEVGAPTVQYLSTKKLQKLPDFHDIVSRLLTHINNLEKTRKELIGEGAADSAIEIEGGLPPPDLEPDEPA